MNIMTASYEFMSRPADERFTNLWGLGAFAQSQRERSMSKVFSTRKVEFAPTEDKRGIVMKGNNRNAKLTHWSFGQMSALAGVPARLLRQQAEHNLSPLAAANLNAGFQVIRDIEDVGLLVREDERVHFNSPEGNGLTLAAATGPNYGRVWNSQLTDALIKKFGNGVDGDWTVPGYFGVPLDKITKDNTTLFASDRDMFVFLADEKRPLSVKQRRNGLEGSVYRVFFMWNSEVGSKTVGLAFFIYDGVCQNRIVWGVEEFQKIAVRHTSGAPDRWVEEIIPTLGAYSHASVRPLEAKIAAAQQHKLEKAAEVLLKYLPSSTVANVMATHLAEEERPIETMWDAVTGITAFAKTIEHTDTRVEMEKIGGSMLDLVKIEVSNSALKELF